MTELLVKPQTPDAYGITIDITPERAGWKHVGFRSHRLTPGQVVSGREEGRETCLVVIAGTAEIEVAGEVFGQVGERATPFEDPPPGAVYAPPRADWRLRAVTEVELGVCSAPSPGGRPPRVITPAHMRRSVRGKGTNTRYIRDILPEDEPADSLLVVEVITPGGNWSSYPSHKHDRIVAGQESQLEETYYHRLNPPRGFSFQRVYTDDRSLDVAMAVEDGAVVMVPRGYHPVAAPHGHTLYYLNVMAGPERAWRFYNDPDHAWILAAG